MEDLQQIEACRSKLPTTLPREVTEITMPLNCREWDWELRDHPDQKFREYIVNRIRNGFRVGFDYTTASCCSSGKKSAVSARATTNSEGLPSRGVCTREDPEAL